MKLSKPIEIPAVWKKLLALDQIPEDAPRAKSVGVPVADPSPYRVDSRVIELASDGMVVQAALCSGDTNYWVDWTLLRNGMVYDEGGPEHDIGDSIVLGEEGYEIEVDVVLTGAR